MKHTYKATGMTCSSCEAKVRSALLTVENVEDVVASAENNLVEITMSKHISQGKLQSALALVDKKYQIFVEDHREVVEQSRSWLETYKPILLIFLYISVISSLVQWNSGTFDIGLWMRHFMAGFFLSFSFFRMLNIDGFAKSYAMYDVVAMQWPTWAYVYTVIELALGLSYLVGFNPLITNIVTVAVMSVSIIGVLRSVLNKRKIQCACLGDVFNLPMSTVTIIEDGLMIGMAVIMLVMT